MVNMRIVVLAAVFLLILNVINCEKKKLKKDITDYTDAEIEKIYEEWEENDDEKLPEDEIPEYMRKQPPKNTGFNIDDLKGKSQDEIMAMTKKGKPLMIMVSVSDNPTKDETERITALWQTSLFNANLEIQRYIVEDGKAIFMINDGSLSFRIKEFLVAQDRCEDVTIDNKVYDGKAKLKRTKQKAKSDL